MQVFLAPNGGFGTMARQADGRIVGAGNAAPGNTFVDFALLRIDPQATPFAYPEALHVGVQSMGTTSFAFPVTITNTGGALVTIGSISIGAPFSVAHSCTTIPVGATCNVDVRFTPGPAGIPIGSSIALSTSMTIASDAPYAPHTVNVSGVAEKSLVTHFYQAVLRRRPDPGGAQYWLSQGLYRMIALGANVNETWFAMAAEFYASAEYAAAARDAPGFVRDLYRTFYDREPDDAGLAYWTERLAAGMPREVVLASFMFSREFVAFTQGIFGNTAARAEVDLVMDFYRGVLGRVPDEGGFNAWVGRLRGAQCAGAEAVRREADAISIEFLASPEYSARNRSTAQYVGDLYNAFLRRGGDLDGVTYWINRVSSYLREEARRAFVASPEFQARLNAVIAQGCL